MVNDFEKETHELTDYELNILLPSVIAGMKTAIGIKKAITSTTAIKMMKQVGLTIDSARFRKIINHIRIHGLINNLVATSKGYHIATSDEEMKRFVESLKQRINSITMVHDAMEFQWNQTKKK